MELTVADALRLEESLIREGRSCEQNWDALVSDANEWFKQATHGRRPAIDSETLASLCETIRFPPHPDAQLIAAGAIRIATRDCASDSTRATLTARFAQHRIRALSGVGPLWSTIQLSPSEREAVNKLFDSAIGDTRLTDDELSEFVADFLKEHRGDRSLFGRLSSDLIRLMALLKAADTSQSQRATARAALTYFARADDIIPDDGGVTGFVDDAYVASRAVAAIDQDRAFVMDKLDKLVARHPFVHDLKFDDSELNLSEFILFNTYIALQAGDKTTAGPLRNAIVCPFVGPAPLMIAFLVAFAEALKLVETDSLPVFTKGEPLVNSEGGAKVIFDSYAKATDRGMETCDATEATHFCYFARSTSRQNVKKAHQVKCHRKIGDIISFRRAPSEGLGRGGSAVFDTGRLRLGPLERLLGLTRPLVLPTNRRRVLVTGNYAESRGILSGLQIGEASLVDYVPTGQARLGEEGVEYRCWSMHDDGSGPLLTIVRNVAEAAAVLDEPDSNVGAVVAHVRAGTTDAVSAARIAAKDVPILAFLDQRSGEDLRSLRESGFGCWDWDQRWFRATDWMRPKRVANCLDKFEKHIRTISESIVTVEQMCDGHLTACHQQLLQLRASLADQDSESLREVLGEGFGVLTSFCRFVLPPEEAPPFFEDRIRDFRQVVTRASRWLGDTEVELLELTVASFDAALEDLTRVNPKFRATEEWLRLHPSGTVVAPRLQHDLLRKALDRDPRTFRDAPSGINTDSLVVAWMRREKMERLLFPPASRNITAILYQPEHEWYRSAEHRYLAGREYAEKLASDRPALAGATRVPSPRRVISTPPIEPPDELIAAARRARAVTYLCGLEGERVSARLIQFVGGHWAAFTEFHRLHSATHLFESPADEDAELRETTASSLVEGDRVVLLKGTDRDALRDEVDRIAPAGLRSQASIWQTALRRCSDATSPESLLRRLENAGCRRTRSTMLRWLHDDCIIGPRSADDVQMIAKATGDAELNASLAQCLRAITKLRGLHVTVAQDLARRVLAHVRESIAAGTLPDELVEVEDRIVMATVEAVDTGTIQVPRGSVNRLQLVS